MSSSADIFKDGAKVVISPDQMRAWITLPAPARGIKYTLQAVKDWLPEHGVVFGAEDALIKKALDSEKYDDLLEVARGKTPVVSTGGDYLLKVEQKPFTGLRAGSDGGLYYDDLSFLQEAQEGQVLAEIVPPTPAEDGMTVTGEVIPPREGTEANVLTGSGFNISEDGRFYTAPSLSHINFVNNQLIVTPLAKLSGLSEQDGPFYFEGNVLIEGDVQVSSTIEATGSIFVSGRTVSSTIKAGNNLLLSGGMRNEGGFGKVTAGGNVWGLFFEACEIEAGGDICANHLFGCEAVAGGRAAIIGGRGAISRTTLYAKGGVVAGTLGGGDSSDSTVISAGMDRETIDRYDGMTKRIDKLTIEIQSLQQNIQAHERVNRMKADKGKGDSGYKEMVARRDQSLSVLNILTTGRSRLKRVMDGISGVTVIARDVALPGVIIKIDTRTLTVLEPLRRCRFRRVDEFIEVTAMAQK